MTSLLNRKPGGASSTHASHREATAPRLAAGILLTCATLYAAFDVHPWATRRAIQPHGPGFNFVVVDAAMYRDSQAQLRDLRLIHNGQPVPFVLKTLYGSTTAQQVTSALTDRTLLPGVGIQFVLEAQPGASHDQVSIATNRVNFRQKVLIETSDDKLHWGVVRRDGTVFDVTSIDAHAAGLAVSYPLSTRRYVRVTIQGWNNPAWLRSASLDFVQTTSAQRDVVRVQVPVVTEDQAHHVTNVQLDLGFARPYDQITLDIGPGWFSRTTDIRTSPDGKNWFLAGTALLLRSGTQQSLTVGFAEQWNRYICLQIQNQDNPPLHVKSARVEALERRLIFPFRQGTAYLYSGNPKAEPAHYDLADVLPADAEEHQATLGQAGRNPEYQPPAPAQDPRSWLLTAVLFLLAPALGAVAFRLLQQTRNSRS